MGGSLLLPALSSLRGPGDGEVGGEGGISSFGSSACAGVSLVLPSASMSGGGPIESSEALFSLGGPDGGGLDGGGGLVASDDSEDGSGIGGGGLVGRSLPDLSKLDIVYLCVVCLSFVQVDCTVKLSILTLPYHIRPKNFISTEEEEWHSENFKIKNHRRSQLG